jgi:hypothetical protein
LRRERTCPTVVARFVAGRDSMTDTPTTEAPIMLRADITRAELADLKVLAIKAGMTTQEFLAMLIRERIAS